MTRAPQRGHGTERPRPGEDNVGSVGSAGGIALLRLSERIGSSPRGHEFRGAARIPTIALKFTTLEITQQIRAIMALGPVLPPVAGEFINAALAADSSSGR
jgi:hypothetical protein